MSGAIRPGHLSISPEDAEVLTLFQSSLPGARRLWATTGYFTPAVLSLLALPIEQMAADRELRIIVGELTSAHAAPFAAHLADLIAEDPDAVRRIGEEEIVRQWRETSAARGALPDAERKGIAHLADMVAKGQMELRGWGGRELLHAKLYLVERADGSRLVIGGSANLTPSGMRHNIEATVVFDDRRPEDIADVDRAERFFVERWSHPETVAIDRARVSKALYYTAGKREVPLEQAVEPPTTAVESAAKVSIVFPPEAIELQPHQIQFIAHAYLQHTTPAVGDSRAGARLLIADEVGLGKSFQLIGFMAMAAMASQKPGLLIVPPSIMTQLQREAARLGVPIAAWDSKGFWFHEGQAWPADGEPGGRGIDKCPTLLGMVSKGLVINNNQKLNSSLLLVGEKGKAFFSCVAVDEAHAARVVYKKKAKRGADRHRVEERGNNLYAFVEQLRSRTESMILATATPMQLQKREVYDLLRLLMRGDQDNAVIGSPDSPWRSDPDGGLDLVGLADPLARDRLPDPEIVQRLLDPVVDSRREAFEDDSPVARAVSQAYRQLGAMGRSGDLQGSGIVYDPTFPAHVAAVATLRPHFGRLTPYRRHIVRRTRAKLEQDPKSPLKPIAVRLYGDNPGEIVVGDPNVIEAAERAIELIRSRVARGALTSSGFMKTGLLRRIFSSPTAGIISLDRLLKGQIGENERIEAADETPEDDERLKVDAGDDSTRVLSDTERAIAEEAMALLREGTDEKYERVVELLERGSSDRPWVEYGCLIFSQFYDTARGVALSLSQDFPGHRVPLYTSKERSGVFVDGQFQQWDRDRLKQSVSDGEFTIVVGTDAASEGLNLQKLGSMVNYDLPWNPVRIDQRQGRIKRIGQPRSRIDVANLRYADTIEDDVYTRLRSRLGDAGQLLGQSFSHIVEPLWDAELDRDEAAIARAEFAIDNAIAEAKADPFDLDSAIDIETDQAVYGFLSSKNRLQIIGRGWDGTGMIEVLDSAAAVGATKAPRARSGTRRVALVDLLRVGLLKANEDLYFCWPEIETKALLTASGQILLRGETYDTPSGAGRALRSAQRSSRPDLRSTAVDGWKFWAVLRDGRRVTVGELRDEYDRQAAQRPIESTQRREPAGRSARIAPLGPAEPPAPGARTRRLWVVHNGRGHEHEAHFLLDGLVGIGWASDDSNMLSPDFDRVLAAIRAGDAQGGVSTIESWAHQTLTFTQEMRQGDIVVTRRSEGTYAIGEIRSDALIDSSGTPHVFRRVLWIEQHMPADRLGGDLRRSFGSARTISTPRSEIKALPRLAAVLDGHADPGVVDPQD